MSSLYSLLALRPTEKKDDMPVSLHRENNGLCRAIKAPVYYDVLWKHEKKGYEIKCSYTTHFVSFKT